MEYNPYWSNAQSNACERAMMRVCKFGSACLSIELGTWLLTWLAGRRAVCRICALVTRIQGFTEVRSVLPATAYDSDNWASSLNGRFQGLHMANLGQQVCRCPPASHPGATPSVPRTDRSGDVVRSASCKRWRLLAACCVAS